ncbi:hypothetical protein Gpo141_00006275 [Globisporangium polare]
MAALTGKLSTPLIQAIPAVRVLSLRATMANYRAQKQLWAQLNAFRSAHNIEIAGACITIYYDMGYKEKDVDAEVCIPVHDDVQGPSADADADAAAEWGDIQLRMLPAIPKAGVISYEGNYDGLPRAYEALYGWIRSSQLEPNGPAREVYVKMDAADATESGYVTEIHQPLA